MAGHRSINVLRRKLGPKRVAKAKAHAKAIQLRRPAKTLSSMNAWMSGHRDEVLAEAKINTKRLTGREVL